MRKPEEYKYYSTQRPVSIGTFPKDHFKAPIRLQNYDGRLPVGGRRVPSLGRGGI